VAANGRIGEEFFVILENASAGENKLLVAYFAKVAAAEDEELVSLAII